jgi:hypothetical protein
VRPTNGEELTHGTLGGDNVVTIDNGTSNDAVVALVAGGRTQRRFYVRAGRVASAFSVPSGAYRVRFALGTGFVRAPPAFCRDAHGFEFDQVEALDQAELKLTLHRVIGGNARTHSIEPAVVLADSSS